MAEQYAHERAHPRRKIYMSCEINHEDRLVNGKIIDTSYGGIGVLIPTGAESLKGEVRIHISPMRESPVESPEEIMLRARPVYLRQKSKGHHAGFRIVQIESGESEWMRLCDSATRNM
jgi:hypothetical protein